MRKRRSKEREKKRMTTNGDSMADLLEGEGHASANDHLVDLVEKVVDDLNLVADLRGKKTRV